MFRAGALSWSATSARPRLTSSCGGPIACFDPFLRVSFTLFALVTERHTPCHSRAPSGRLTQWRALLPSPTLPVATQLVASYATPWQSAWPKSDAALGCD